MQTIQTVARIAGVSVATVSRVINNPSVVTEKTRIKVEKVINDLNYEPSVHGRNLRTSESRLLLILIPSISNPFYADIISGIEKTAFEQGYITFIYETDSHHGRKKTYSNLLRNRLADGIISMDPTVNKQELFSLANQYPVVQCSEYDVEGSISYVAINHKLAAYDAVKYLIKLGHKKIALINSHSKYLYSRERRKGYEKALNEFNLPINTDWIYNTQKLSFENGQRASSMLLNMDEKPTAIFAVSDILAIGALKEVNMRGLKIPNDMAIIGFDKISFSNMTHPTLTTISQPRYEMGVTSATMLIEKIKGKQTKSIILDHELVIRNST